MLKMKIDGVIVWILLCVPFLNLIIGLFFIVHVLSGMLSRRRYFSSLVFLVLCTFLFIVMLGAGSKGDGAYWYVAYCLGCFFLVEWSARVIDGHQKNVMNNLVKNYVHGQIDFTFGSHMIAAVDIKNRNIIFCDENDLLQLELSEITSYKHSFVEKSNNKGKISTDDHNIVFETRRIATPIIKVAVDSKDDGEIAIARLNSLF